MQILLTHIDRARQQPHHVRRQIAFVVAGALAGLIAFVWLGVSIALGSFDLKGPTSFGQGPGGAFASADTSSSANTQLASVGATLPAKADTAPHIEIIDAAPAVSSVQSEKTYIPF